MLSQKMKTEIFYKIVNLRRGGMMGFAKSQLRVDYCYDYITNFDNFCFDYNNQLWHDFKAAVRNSFQLNILPWFCGRHPTLIGLHKER
jgi:hypothetical protein